MVKDNQKKKKTAKRTGKAARVNERTSLADCKGPPKAGAKLRVAKIGVDSGSPLYPQESRFGGNTPTTHEGDKAATMRRTQ